ncbi:unnamed protein product [Schistocephalus solidus]|uniref:Uncharacterized protein n=1 Tax=Schistocephalus solidus TaxID=70667 RepID=A0A183TR15_SCHSO|nr:unnamed protein product [Schistocephalus solidus]
MTFQSTQFFKTLLLKPFHKEKGDNGDPGGAILGRKTPSGAFAGDRPLADTGHFVTSWSDGCVFPSRSSVQVVFEGWRARTLAQLCSGIMSFYSKVFSQSSLVPLAKIASARTRSQRIIWVTITAAMFMGLCICITLVTLQYSRHQTVFQLDYSGRHTVYDQTPGITICPEGKEMLRLFKHASRANGWPETSVNPPWEDPPITVALLKLITDATKEPPGVIGHHLPPGKLKWDTQHTAKSPIYRRLHNFSVQFRIKPAHLEAAYQIFVLEQV